VPGNICRRGEKFAGQENAGKIYAGTIFPRQRKIDV